jgi:repressor LexA
VVPGVGRTKSSNDSRHTTKQGQGIESPTRASSSGADVRNTNTDTPLSPRQRQILAFIERYKRDRGFPPTVREIQKGVGLQSPSSVHAHLRKLERSGYLTRQPSRSRTLGLGPARRLLELETPPQPPPTSIEEIPGADGNRVANDTQLAARANSSRLDASELDQPFVTVPVVGRIAAGQPLEALEEADEEIPVASGIFGHIARARTRTFRPAESYFFIRVRGDSMQGAGILDGDLVLVHRQDTAQPGDIVVALLDDEATVKRLQIVGRDVYLAPENPFMKPIHVKREELRILGKVVGLIRPEI